MARKVFTSFHYQPDNWRASTIRNIGKIEGNSVVSSNKWEEVTNGGDSAIRNWIDDNMRGKSCLIVLVGQNTAGRKWINYEIQKAWDDNKGVLGIHIHKIKNSKGEQASKGSNPFSQFSFSSKVKCYDSVYSSSSFVYDDIKENIVDWIEEAIKIRNNN